MNGSPQHPYDQLPYPPLAHPHTRISRLRSIAMLYGAAPPPLAGARVLELGCGVGWNLIPMAQRHADASFLGIDYSARQILAAQADARTLGLGNLEFRHQDIRDLDGGLGSFDYIIAHGLYSWVPPEVREGVLQVLGGRLAPAGIAFLSYNCLPGWHYKSWVRDLMRFGAELGEGTRDLGAALAFLQAAAAAPSMPPHGKEALAGALGKLAKEDPAYLVHEYLEDQNTAFLFSDFVGDLQAHGLQYLADAEDNAELLLDWPPPCHGRLGEGSSWVAREQCADFLRNRAFRKSLLCRATVPLDRAGVRERIPEFWLASLLQRDPGAGNASVFATRDGQAGMRIAHPILRATLVRLQEAYPFPLPFKQLWEEVRTEAGASLPALLDQLHQVWRLGFLDLQERPAPYPSRPGERPEVFPCARLQAQRTGPLTNLDHGPVRVEDRLRGLLPFIDGSRSRDELAAKAVDLGLLPMGPAARIDPIVDQCFRLGLLVR